jgi:hypothetical protein
MDGACQQFFSRLLFPTAANFQKREYAEHNYHRSHNTEQRPTARSQPGQRKEVSHWQSAQTREGAFRLWRPDGKGNLTALPLNKFLGINLG